MKAKSTRNSPPAPVEDAAMQETKSLATRRKEWQRVGNELATVLADPNTPTNVYNNLVEGIDEMTSEHDLCLTHPAILRLAYPIIAEIAEDGKYGGPAYEAETVDELYQRLARDIYLLLERIDVPRKLKNALTKFYAELDGEVVGNMDCLASEVRSTLPLICQALSGKKGGRRNEK